MDSILCKCFQICLTTTDSTLYFQGILALDIWCGEGEHFRQTVCYILKWKHSHHRQRCMLFAFHSYFINFIIFLLLSDRTLKIYAKFNLFPYSPVCFYLFIFAVELHNFNIAIEFQIFHNFHWRN